MTNTKIIVAVVAVAIIAIVGWFVPTQQLVDQASLKNYIDKSIQSAVTTFGGTTNYDSLELSETLTVGGDATFGTTATTTIDINLFCIEYHPTSTETTVKLTASTTAPTGSSPLVAAYGSCS